MVCDPSTTDVKEEVNGQVSTGSSSSIVQLYNHPQGGKRWTVEALYESCRLKVLMVSIGQMSE